MSRRRPLTKEQLAEIAEAARGGPDGKPLRETMRGMIEGTATVPRPVAPPRQPLPPRHPGCVHEAMDAAGRDLLPLAGPWPHGLIGLAEPDLQPKGKSQRPARSHTNALCTPLTDLTLHGECGTLLRRAHPELALH